MLLKLTSFNTNALEQKKILMWMIFFSKIFCGTKKCLYLSPRLWNYFLCDDSQIIKLLT